MVGSPSNLSDFSGPSALEQRLDAFVFKALPSRSGSFNGDVDADSEDIEDLLRERKVEDVPVSGKAWNATTEPHAPPLFKKQLEAIRASNARGTVEEFHDLLSSLSDDISGSGPGSDPGPSSTPKKVAHETRENRHPAFVSLCAAVLSAQTRDRTAIRGIQQLAQRLGIQQRGKDLDFSPEAIALAPPGLVEECLKGVNYFKTKAKRLAEIAALILTQHRGSVPSTFQDLVKLPGVGAKVANLVLSVTFGQRDAGMVVDTHVFRVARRLGWSDARNPEETRQQLERFMSCDLREEVTLKLIAFGQAVCRPQYPKCQECLLSQQGICPTYQRRCTTAVGTPTTFQKLEPSPKRKRTLIDLED